MTSRFSIDPATRDDVALILHFIRELAEYEREPDAVVATEQQLETALFGPSPKVFCVICRDGETPIGFALYFFNFSTWLGRHGLYLEDLYVTPAHRGQGAGKRLFAHLAAIAVDEGCGRFEWNVLKWNTPAIDFYKKYKAIFDTDWWNVKIILKPRS